jgi:hypothetical protein
VAYFGSIPTKPRLSSWRVHRWLGPGSRLKQPYGPIDMIIQVLATRGVGVLNLNLLRVRRLVELLAKAIVLRFEIIILTKEAQARFVASLVWGRLRW